MAELKTRATNASVKVFLNSIDNKQKRDDAFAVAAMMEKATGKKPKMWGPAIVGFGIHPYVYSSGREGDWPITAFSPRKQSLVLYFATGFFEENVDLLRKLGKHKTGKVCLYINRLEDVHLPTLKKLIQLSVKDRLRRAE